MKDSFSSIGLLLCIFPWSKKWTEVILHWTSAVHQAIWSINNIEWTPVSYLKPKGKTDTHAKTPTNKKAVVFHGLSGDSLERYGLKRSLTLDLWELVSDAMRKVVDDMRGARGGLGMVTVAFRWGWEFQGRFCHPGRPEGLVVAENQIPCRLVVHWKVRPLWNTLGLLRRSHVNPVSPPKQDALFKAGGKPLFSIWETKTHEFHGHKKHHPGGPPRRKLFQPATVGKRRIQDHRALFNSWRRWAVFQKRPPGDRQLSGFCVNFLGGGFKHFLFLPLPGEMIQFD